MQPFKSIAVLLPNGRILTPLENEPAIHGVLRERMGIRGPRTGVVDGWLTPEGRFVDRAEAMEIAKAHGLDPARIIAESMELRDANLVGQEEE